jgi:hypothetical protein
VIVCPDAGRPIELNLLRRPDAFRIVYDIHGPNNLGACDLRGCLDAVSCDARITEAAAMISRLRLN